MDKKGVLIAVLAVLLLAACVPAAPSPAFNKYEAFIVEKFLTEDLNESLQINFDLEGLALAADSLVNIHVSNNSNKTIKIDLPEDVHLFAVIDGEFVAVTNDVTYTGDGLILGPASDPYLGFIGSILTKPTTDDLQDFKSDSKVVFLVIGHFLFDNKPTGQLVGAYLITQLSAK